MALDFALRHGLLHAKLAQRLSLALAHLCNSPPVRWQASCKDFLVVFHGLSTHSSYHPPGPSTEVIKQTTWSNCYVEDYRGIHSDQQIVLIDAVNGIWGSWSYIFKRQVPAHFRTRDTVAYFFKRDNRTARQLWGRTANDDMNTRANNNIVCRMNRRLSKQ